MASKSRTSKLAKLSIGTDASPIVWTALGEVTGIAQAGRSVETLDSTSMDSEAKEFIAGMRDEGTYAIDYFRLGSDDDGQIALEAAFQASETAHFRIDLPKAKSQTTSGDVYSFDALVQDVNYSFSPTKQDTGKATLKVSGAITEVAGE